MEHFILPHGTAAPQVAVIDHRAVVRSKLSKTTRACYAADWMSGAASLIRPSVRLATEAMQVSIAYAAAAKRLTSAERVAVRRGVRPLIVRPAPKPVQLPLWLAMPIPTPEERLRTLVAEIGVAAALELLAGMEAAELLAAAA
jgi:hypothetical protein